MKKTYILLLVLGTVLFSACERKGTKTGPDVVRRQDPDVANSLTAFDMFGQSKSYVGALGVEPGNWGDGTMYFSFDLGSSHVTYDFPEGRLSCPKPYASASSETVPEGTTRVPFHLEFPLRVEQAIPKEIQDIESVGIGGQYEFTITLDPDFPFTKARLEEAVFTLPDWVREEYPFWLEGNKMAWWYLPDEIYPGKVETFSVNCSAPELYKLKAGESVREPGHILDLDATIVLDGVLSVDEQDRVDPGAASAPWGFSLLANQRGGTQVHAVRGRIALDRAMPDIKYTFEELPYFLYSDATVFDLDDFSLEFQIRNDLGLPINLSGDVRCDDRTYPFGAPSFPSVGDGQQARVSLSEKGTGLDPQRSGYIVPIDGFSQLLHKNPGFISVENLRVSGVTQDLQTIRLDGQRSVLVYAGVNSPLRPGEKFQTRYYLSETMLIVPPVLISRLAGSFTVENTLPFDYEIRPVFLNASRELLTPRTPLQVIHVPSGSPADPATKQVTFDWHIDLPAMLLYFEATGRTAAGRQGETMDKDQYLAIDDLYIEIYRAEE